VPNLAPKNTITRSATEFIKSALRLVGSLRSGQNLSNSELTDSAQVLNDLLDAWSAERVMIFTVPYMTVDQNNAAFTLVPGQQKYTVGNANGTESFKIPRPARIDGISLLYNASQPTPVELAMEIVDDVGWQAISNKTTQSLLPQVVYVEATADGTDWNLYFWPIPTQANNIALYLWAGLTQFPNLEAQFSFPPGYAEALRYNLAVRLAAEFPCDLQKLQLVTKLAGESKARIVGINSVVKEAWCDPAIVGGYGNLGNIYTDSPARNRDS
jgi:hypothetical protein